MGIGATARAGKDSYVTTPDPRPRAPDDETLRGPGTGRTSTEGFRYAAQAW